MKYSELNLDPVLNAAIESLNYVEMTPIQEQTIPHILEGKDVAGLAQTGTGKTAAFVIPLIERFLKTKNQSENSSRIFKSWNARSFVLILVPTRELADQINDNVVKIAAGSGLKSYPLYGGTGYEKQKEALNSGLQFVVSTPGRLIDLFKENHVDLKQVIAIVFDEADRMFDMGFKDDMKYILSRVPRERQFLVFSATLNFDVLNTAYQFGAEPVEINISRDQAKAENVTDFIIHLGHEEKPQHLLSILKKENPKQAMIFTNFKHNVDRIADFLMRNKIPAMGISSLMSQAHRNQVIEKFKADNDQNILVATDVAARGLDINGVDLVLNFEMPQDAESYVHRIGRTGRAGREGKAFSLICDRDIDSLYRVEEYTKKKIEIAFLEDVDLIKEFEDFRSEEHFANRNFEKRGDKFKGRGQDRKRRPDQRSEQRPDQRPSRGQAEGDMKSASPNDARPVKNHGEANRDRGDRNSKDPRRKNGKPPIDRTRDRNPEAIQDRDSKSMKSKDAPMPNSKPKNDNRPLNGSISKETKRNFRSNSSAKSGSKGIAQKVKQLFNKIFG